jgi:N utilization substance protein A
LVKEDQLSLAIGRRGQNVRLASKLVGWDIEIMTHEELNEGIERAEGWFSAIPGVTDQQVEAFIEEGFLSYDDLTFIEPAQLAELAGVTEEEADEIIVYAEGAAEQVEEETRAAKLAAEENGAQEEAVASSNRSSAPTAANIFPADQEPTAPEEAKPTMESLFGPDDDSKAAESSETLEGAEATNQTAEPEQPASHQTEQESPAT